MTYPAKISKSQLNAQEALDVYTRVGSKTKAIELLGLVPSTLYRRLERAAEMGLRATRDSRGNLAARAGNPEDRPKLKIPKTVEHHHLIAADRKIESVRADAKLTEERMRDAEERADRLQRELAAVELVAKSSTNVETPDWALNPARGGGILGVPTLLLSDLHWGEVVDPAQVEGFNEYNLKIANQRGAKLIQTAVDLCKTHMAKASIPGFVLAGCGDFFAGDIHEELLQTNEEVTPAVYLDILKYLIWAIDNLADHFGKVFVPWVVGNHGRLTRKPNFKNSVRNNWDWLLGKALELHFKDDKRITFRVSESRDTQYRVYNTNYCLSHGDQFKGGSGIAGLFSALALGDARKRKRQQAVGKAYEYLVMGHWHQYVFAGGLIVNGSLVGYDEYAYGNNLHYEQPTQSLWMTHPTHGITYRMPILLDDGISVAKRQKAEKSAWVTIPAA